MFETLNSTRYTLRVVATNRHPDKVFIKRIFETSSDPDRCTVHMINEGVVVAGDSATVEFTGRGPAKGHHCSLDKMSFYKCEL